MCVWLGERGVEFIKFADHSLFRTGFRSKSSEICNDGNRHEAWRVCCRGKAPHVIEHPKGQRLQEGQPFELSVVAEGKGPMQYQVHPSPHTLYSKDFGNL